MKIETGKRPIARNGGEYDLICAKKYYCYLCNHIQGARKIKRQMIRRFRRSQKIIIKTDLENA